MQIFERPSEPMTFAEALSANQSTEFKYTEDNEFRYIIVYGSHDWEIRMSLEPNHVQHFNQDACMIFRIDENGSIDVPKRAYDEDGFEVWNGTSWVGKDKSSAE